MANKFLKICILAAFCLPVSAVADNTLPFSNIYAFGDSLTDTGNIPGSPHTNKNADHTAALYINDLANSLDLSISPSSKGGNNYADSSAVTGPLPFNSSSSDIPTLADQVNQYLAHSNNKTDSHSLYVLWGGANDLGALLERKISPTITPQQLISISTNNIVNIINSLHQANAQYIVVPNIPNLGNTPVIKSMGQAWSDQVSDLTKTYNAQLLSSLNATGISIIQVDMAGMFDAMQTNYAKFGFIGPESNYSSSPDAYLHPAQYIFYDGFHPSQASHKIGADYILSVLEGPQFASFLAQTPLSVMSAQNSQIQSELLGLQTGNTNVSAGQWRVFMGGNYAQSQKDAGNVLSAGYHQDASSFTLGADYHLNSDSLMGFAVGRSMGKVHYGAGSQRFKFDLDENMINIFGGYQFYQQQAYINTAIGYGNIDDSNIQRSFMLGNLPETVNGQTTGQHYDVDLNMGYNFKFSTPAIKTGPIASLEYQRIHINPYAESSSQFQTSTGAFDALQYDSQNSDSLTGGLGWQLNYKTTFNNAEIIPYIQATYNHQFLKKNDEVTAGVTSLPGSHFSVPQENPYQDYGLAALGIQSIFNNKLAMTVSYNYLNAKHFTSDNFMLNFSLPL